MTSSIFSEKEGEGLKYIASRIQELLKEFKVMNYEEILLNINVRNKSTLRRRVYDVLSVMRALNLVKKEQRQYHLTTHNQVIELRDSIDDKKRKLEELANIKMALEFLVKRNMAVKKDLNTFSLPFLIVMADKNSNIHCETDENRKFFRFKCTSRMMIMDDLKVLKLIYENKENQCINENTQQLDVVSENNDSLDFFI